MLATIYKKELRQYFNSASGVIAILVFLVLAWLFCWVLPNTSFINYGYAEMGSFFDIAPYLLIFLIPALGMRLWAEEYQLGTHEYLLTKPVAVWQYSIAKFLSAYTLVFVALAASLVFFYSLYAMASPVGNIDVSGVMGSYLGLLLLAAVFIAISLYCSAVTGNQVTAFILAVCICFVLYEICTQLSQIDALPSFAKNGFDIVSLQAHYRALGRGVMLPFGVAYFVSVAYVFMLLANRKVTNK
jgi:ABC-2 type transport system permease protein